MAVLYVGTCGWPMARPRYFRRFNAVEVQQTFYEPPSAETASRWAAEAPTHFAFSVKAWQLITHPATSPTYRRLKRTALDEAARQQCGFFAPTGVVERAFERTVEIARAVRARAILFQTPAAFGPTTAHVSRLRGFFRSHPPDDRLYVWEPRGDWPPELVRRLCDELGLVHGTDPFLREPVAGRVTYLRLHGRGGYRYRYTDDDLAHLRRMVLQHLESREEVWCLFNNVSMAEDAGRFLSAVGERGLPR